LNPHAKVEQTSWIFAREKDHPLCDVVGKEHSNRQGVKNNHVRNEQQYLEPKEHR
jgi:hypothetical protein